MNRRELLTGAAALAAYHSLPAPAEALSLSQTLELLGGASGLPAREVAPSYASPATGTFYVSGSGATALPTGSDSNNGSEAAPFATLSFAQSQVPAGGDYKILGDGSFAENTAAGGRFILNRSFTKPVLFDSYTGDPSKFIITNASGTAGVITVRSTAVANYQIRRATIQSSTDGNPLFLHNPASAGLTGTNVQFFDCVLKHRTQGGLSPCAIDLRTDVALSGLYFVRCTFQRVAGASTAFNPQLIGSSLYTASVNNQPYADVGFWDCAMSDAQWTGWSTSANGFGGVAKFTAVRNDIKTGTNYGILLGKDTSGDTTPKCTDVYIRHNTINAGGTNAHGVLIGSNVQAADVRYNTIVSTLQGIVTKGSATADCENNQITLNPVSATPTALYAKASSGSMFRNNTVSVDGSTFACYGFREDVDGSNKASNTELTGNRLTLTGASATALLWAGASGSTGGANSNNNNIALANGAALGSVRGTTVANLAALQAAWVSSGLPGDLATNDSATVVQ